MDSSEAVSTDPLYVLPTELSLKILEEFIPRSHNRRELALVVNLSSVCRNWRRIITNTAGFWTHVSLNPSGIEKKYRQERYPACLERQLQRTGTALLDISWYICGEMHPELMRILRVHAPLERWRSLSLYQVVTTGVPMRVVSDIYVQVSTACCFPLMEGALSNLVEIKLEGDAPLCNHFVDLLDHTALQLQQATIGRTYSTLLPDILPNTLRRLRLLAVTRYGCRYGPRFGPRKVAV